MTQYTPSRSLPYPEGTDQVAVHTDVQALAMKADTEMQQIHSSAVVEAQEAAETVAQNVASHVARDAAEQVAVPHRVTNLFDYDDTVSGTLSPSGNVNDHATNRVSPFIPVTSGTPYVSWSEFSHRVVFFDSDYNALSGTNTDWLVTGQAWHHIPPTGARFVRVGATVTSVFTPMVIFNRGTTVWSPGGPVETGWWDDRELPPNQPVRVEDLAFIENGRIGAQYLDGAVPERITNLFDYTQAVSGQLSESGNIIPHAINVVSEPIPVSPGEQYVSINPVSTHRVVWFTSQDTVISGTDTAYQPTGEPSLWVAPDDAAYALFGVNMGGGHTPATVGAVFNKGTTVWSPDEPVETGWWDDRELPPGAGAVDEGQLTDLVEKLLPQWEPSHPTLQFISEYEGWDEPYWLSVDGQVLYGRRGVNLVQSEDEWATRQDVHKFDQSIQAVRTLDDGELLVSTSRDESVGVKAKLFKSSGYDRATPTAATWTEVLEAGATQANINNSWGLQVYQNIVIAGEYGLRGEEGARRVWMSEDHGDTFRLVFDQKTVVAEGRPVWTENGHVHTAVWDPYWSRLWVAVGDNPNTATYYSDDRGDTWTYIEGTGGPAPAVQYTGIMPLPDVVLFGSDRSPNGVHAYRRGNKSDMPVIKPLILVDDEPTLTRVFQLPFKRDWSPTTPTYFAAAPAADNGPSVIVATVDGKKGHIVWEGEHPGSGAPFSGSVRRALGPTVQGNIIIQVGADPGVVGARVAKAPAPTWVRA